MYPVVAMLCSSLLSISAFNPPVVTAQISVIKNRYLLGLHWNSTLTAGTTYNHYMRCASNSYGAVWGSLSQTSPNPTTNNAGFLPAVNVSSNIVPHALNVGGMQNLGCFVYSFMQQCNTHSS